MSTLIAPAIVAGLLLLLAVLPVALCDTGSHPRLTLAFSRFATRAMALIAIGAVLVSLFAPDTTLPAAGLFSLQTDLLATSMLAMIAFIGLIVTEFGRRYLEGDGRHALFLGKLCLTLAAACALVTAGTLVLFWLAWVATSLSLHQLLVFYPERPLARLAARKKFVIARLTDAALLLAFALLARDFGTFDIGTIAAQATATTAPGLPLAAALIVLAALLKSAQFPLHGWLTEVMETPTPVSALLHAGIVNAGGFLVLRLAPVLLAMPTALHWLAVVGAITALFGSAVMLTQSSIKEFLAWSTISQMGFMFLQCGLGLFPLAWLHIVAHSFYKAHAFLSAGSVVVLARDAWLPDLRQPPRLTDLLLNMAVALGLYLAAGWSLGLLPREQGAALALGSTTVLGLTTLLVQSRPHSAGAPLLDRTLLMAALTGLSCVALQALALQAMEGVLPIKPSPDTADRWLLAGVLTAFPALMIAQYLLPLWYASAAGKALRVHLANGLYLNLVLNRLLGAFRRVTP